MTRSADAQQLSLGVLARSRKKNERRLPIHPAHFARIEPELRPRIFLEHGYGSDFGATDDALAGLVGGIRTREQLVADCDVILLPKVQAEDLAELRDRTGRLGLAALRAGFRPDADRHRPAVDADRVRGDEPLAAPTAGSACTSFTRTTSSRATAPSCTPCN